MKRTCASWATLTPSCIRLQDAGCRGPPRAALSLVSHPAQFPWLRRHPPAPFLARSPAAVAWWADEGSCVLLKASVRVGAPHNVTQAKFCHFPRPFPSRPHSRSVPVPYPGNARPPVGPGDAGEGRAAQAKLLSCGARSEVAAATTASRPLPGLRRPERTPTGHRPLPALSLVAPAETWQHPHPAPTRSPGFQRSRAGGGRRAHSTSAFRPGEREWGTRSPPHAGPRSLPREGSWFANTSLCLEGREGRGG